MVSALFLSLACAKEEKEFQRDITLDAPVYGIMAPIIDDEPETKATVNPTNWAYQWEIGDPINIWSEEGTLLIYSVKQVAGISATFDGGGFHLDEGKEYYSSHPLILSPRDNYKALTTTYVGQTQTANNNADHVAEYMYTYAKATCTEGKTGFRYDHLSSFIRFTITFPVQSVTVKKITLTADKEIFALDGKADVTTGAFTAGTM